MKQKNWTPFFLHTMLMGLSKLCECQLSCINHNQRKIVISNYTQKHLFFSIKPQSSNSTPSSITHDPCHEFLTKERKRRGNMVCKDEEYSYAGYVVITHQSLESLDKYRWAKIYSVVVYDVNCQCLKTSLHVASSWTKRSRFQSPALGQRE